MRRLHSIVLLALPLLGAGIALELAHLLTRQPWPGYTLAASDVSGVTMLVVLAACGIVVVTQRRAAVVALIVGIAALTMQGLLVLTPGTRLGVIDLAAALALAFVLERTVALSRTRTSGDFA